jgi:hypothetical protein
MDDLLTKIVAPSENVANLLAFSVAQDRRFAIDRHLHRRPLAKFGTDSKWAICDLVCGESRFFGGLAWIHILGVTCFLRCSVDSRIWTRSFEGMPARVCLKKTRTTLLNCTRPYGEENQVSSTDGTPRGQQLKEAVKADLQPPLARPATGKLNFHRSPSLPSTPTATAYPRGSHDERQAYTPSSLLPTTTGQGSSSDAAGTPIYI